MRVKRVIPVGEHSLDKGLEVEPACGIIWCMLMEEIGEAYGARWCMAFSACLSLNFIARVIGSHGRFLTRGGSCSDQHVIRIFLGQVWRMDWRGDMEIRAQRGGPRSS